MNQFARIIIPGTYVPEVKGMEVTLEVSKFYDLSTLIRISHQDLTVDITAISAVDSKYFIPEDDEWLMPTNGLSSEASICFAEIERAAHFLLKKSQEPKDA